MEREQIIKALGYCIPFSPKCGECPYREIADLDGCIATNMRNALALIEELTEENDTLKDTNEHLAVILVETKADTVRKMQERLKEHLEKPEFPWDSFTVAEEVIDQIAKEMLEES